MASPLHMGWTTVIRAAPASMSMKLSVAHGGPDHVRFSTFGSPLFRSIVPSATDAPSPGVPEIASMSMPESSFTSIRTVRPVESVRSTLNRAAIEPLAVGYGALVGAGVGTRLGSDELDGAGLGAAVAGGAVAILGALLAAQPTSTKLAKMADTIDFLTFRST
jgi:hypothetical protein